jgi:hypothetical protein
VGNLPASSAASKISAPGWSRSARSEDKMGLKSVRPALGGASHGHEEPPRCRHSAPLSIAAALHEGHAHAQTFRSILGSPRAAVHNKLNATKHKLPIVDAELWTKSKVPQERLGNS